ncbi:hypothetical protein [Micromonospora chersina]
MTTPANQPEPYTPQFNPLSYACHRCGALVQFADEAKALHNEFHARMEADDLYEAERREREG